MYGCISFLLKYYYYKSVKIIIRSCCSMVKYYSFSYNIRYGNVVYVIKSVYIKVRDIHDEYPKHF